MARSRQRKSLGLIARLFGNKKPVEKPVKRHVDPEILVRLNELCEKHTFVDVSFVGRSGMAYQSLIIDVDAKSQSIRIDELYPLENEKKIVVGEEIEITSRGKGLPVQFTSTITALEIYEGSPAYRIALPSKIKANQRRGFFRIDVTRDMDISLHIPLKEGGLGFCTILNISSSGVSFKFDKNITDQIGANRILKSAKLTLPGNIAMYCDLEVRSYDFKRAPYRYTLIGAKIDDLSPAEKKQFDKYLLKLQREAKRVESDLEQDFF